MSKRLLLGLLLLSLLFGAALLSLVWTPYPHAKLNVLAKFSAPSGAHWLGTDQLGRDLVSLLMVGARNSLAIAVAAVALGGALGTALGLTAAARGGWLQVVILRLGDISLAFPTLLFAILLAAAFGPSLWVTTAAIAFVNIPVFARLTRASAAQIWTRDYVLAARAAGERPFGITRHHILPNIASVLTVQASTEIAVAILTEAALSYLGLGTQPPDPSWGRMLAESQTLLFMAPTLALYPGICIVLAVMGFGLVADGLRPQRGGRSA